MKVTLTEEPLAGSYVVAEHHDDGTLVLRPENSDHQIGSHAATDRRIDEIAERHGETLERLAVD